jgi:hypothetical protein
LEIEFPLGFADASLSERRMSVENDVGVRRLIVLEIVYTTGGKFVVADQKSRAETKLISFAFKTKQKVSKKLF